MKFVKLFCIAVFFVLGVFSLFSTFSTAYSAPKIDAAFPIVSSAQDSVRETYAQNCARCHGADGRGQTTLGKTLDAPNIADANWQKRHNDKKIAAKIVRGGGGMPAFAKKLSAKDINSLVAYVRSLKK